MPESCRCILVLQRGGDRYDHRLYLRAKKRNKFIELEDERNAWRAKYSSKWRIAFWCQEFARGKNLLEMLGVEIVPPWMIMAMFTHIY